MNQGSPSGEAPSPAKSQKKGGGGPNQGKAPKNGGGGPKQGKAPKNVGGGPKQGKAPKNVGGGPKQGKAQKNVGGGPKQGKGENQKIDKAVKPGDRLEVGEIVIYQKQVCLVYSLNENELSLVVYQLKIPSQEDLSIATDQSWSDDKVWKAVVEKQRATVAVRKGIECTTVGEVITSHEAIGKKPKPTQSIDVDECRFLPVLVLHRRYFGVVGNVVGEKSGQLTIMTTHNQVDHLNPALFKKVCGEGRLFNVNPSHVIPYEDHVDDLQEKEQKKDEKPEYGSRPEEEEKKEDLEDEPRPEEEEKKEDLEDEPRPEEEEKKEDLEDEPRPEEEEKKEDLEDEPRPEEEEKKEDLEGEPRPEEEEKKEDPEDEPRPEEEEKKEDPEDEPRPEEQQRNEEPEDVWGIGDEIGPMG